MGSGHACSATHEASDGLAISGVKEAAPASNPAAAQTFEPKAYVAPGERPDARSLGSGLGLGLRARVRVRG